MESPERADRPAGPRGVGDKGHEPVHSLTSGLPVSKPTARSKGRRRRQGEWS